MKTIDLILPVTFMLCSNFLPAQHLLLNPGFESIDSAQTQGSCTIGLGYQGAIYAWRGINTVDFAHTLFPFSMRQSSPHSGKGMAGVYLKDQGDGWLPEILFQEIKPGILKGDTCEFEAYIKLSNSNIYTTNLFQIKLSNNNLCEQAETFQEDQIIDVSILNSNVWDWQKVDVTFIAARDFQYFAIGIFRKIQTRKQKATKNATVNGVYVWFDDLDLTVSRKPEQMPSILFDRQK
ncbi:MAG: hypothetical protein J0L99_13955 [Chitinophagales bacterium]|nr:hypothetical protein [Chitinophagales bacterium]